MANKISLKEKIINESLKLFSLKGYLSTTIDDILREVNASKGGFYNHFKSKDELFYAVLKEAQNMWRERVLEGLELITNPIEKLRQLLINYRDRYLKDSDSIPGGCVFVTFSVEFDDQRPDFAEEINKGYVALKAMIRRLLDQARTSGNLKEGVNTQAVSDMVFSGMLGTSVLYGMDKSDETLKRSIDPLIDYLDSLVAWRSSDSSA